MENRRRFNIVAIAGTFDRLHKGHRYFISQAFKLGERVIIGLTSDEYVGRKFQIQNSKSQINPKNSITDYQTQKIESGEDTSDGVPHALLRGGGIKIQSYSMRKKELENYLRSENLIDRAEIVKINDVYGPAIDPKVKIEALIVTKDSKKGAREVNRKRHELRLRPLKLLKLPIIMADDRKKIASTRIRIGEIDKAGKVFLKLVYNPTDRMRFTPISDNLRKELKKPQGVMIRGDANDLNRIVPKLKSLIGKLKPVIIGTVGDEVTKICNNACLAPDLAIFDYKVNRIKKYHSLSELGFRLQIGHSGKPKAHPESDSGQAGMTSLYIIQQVVNPPGHITKDLVDAVSNAYFGIIKDNKQRLIQVIGEDDLAALPAILLSPLGSVVIYGQPGEGVVVVEVTEEKKEEMIRLLDY